MLTKVPQCGCGDGFKWYVFCAKSVVFWAAVKQRRCVPIILCTLHSHIPIQRRNQNVEREPSDRVCENVDASFKSDISVLNIQSSMVLGLFIDIICNKYETTELLPRHFGAVRLDASLLFIKKVASIKSSRHLKTEHPAVKMLDNKYKTMFKSPEFKILNRYKH